MTTEPDPTQTALVDLARAIRDRVVAAHRSKPGVDLASPAGQATGDLQYAIDRVSEEGLAELAAERFSDGPIRLLAEGTRPEGVVLGCGGNRRLLVIDPIDGTRGLMHDKRSAFVLAAIAPDRDGARLRDVTCAVMVEIPTSRSDLSDVFAATRGAGVRGFTENVVMGTRVPLSPAPSTATTFAHGFASFSRFFAGAADRIGALSESFFDRVAEIDPLSCAAIFEDQFISNGGQCHALLTGRDRFVADLRPLFRDRRGDRLMCAHPYDVLAAVILEEAGLPVTDERGAPLDPPLDLSTDVGFVAWANGGLRARFEEALRDAIDRHAR